MKPKFEIVDLSHNMYQIYGDVRGTAESFYFEGVKRFKYDFTFFTPKGVWHRITWNNNMTITNLGKLEDLINRHYERAIEEER